MALKVIGAGFGRTGTSSLKTALEALGFGPCYYMTELLGQPEHVEFWERAERGEPVDWEALFARYRAGVDYPVARHYRTLAAAYPEAKVILTVRDPERWYESAKSTIYRAGPSPLQKVLLGLQLPFSPRLRKLVRVFRLVGEVWRKDFGGSFDDKAHALAVYRRHLEEVEGVVAPERLLVYDVAKGWGPLCRFLGVPVPDLPFLRTNDRAAFAQNQRRGVRSLLKPLRP